MATHINAEPLHFVLEKFSSPMKKKLLAVGVAVLVSRCPRHTVINKRGGLNYTSGC
jgi:hypothetical protein